MPQIKVPAALAGGSSTETIHVEGETVGAVLDQHAETHGPELRDSVVDDDGIKEFINVFVDGEEADGLDQGVAADALIRIMPAASGGTGCYSFGSR